MTTSNKNKKLTIGVIFGGRSGEHEVSLVSAVSVIKNLDRKKYLVVPIGISREGRWLFNQPLSKLKKGVKKGEGDILLSNKLIKKVDVFFPVLHGTFGEDGTIQGLFEMINKPYVGAGVLGSATAMDKVIQKELAKAVGLPIVKYDWFLKSDWLKNRLNILRRLDKLKYPLFVKPVNSGSSVGVSRAGDKKELVKAINLAAKFDRKIIVEQGVKNPRELQCAILGNDAPLASVIGEVVPKNDFYDFAAKYYDDKTEYYFPAKNLTKKQSEAARQLALTAYRSLDLNGLARVELFLASGKIYLNEINTMPGFTGHSIYPKLWEASGLAYPRLLDKLIELALMRYEEKSLLTTDFKSGSNWYKES